MRAQSGIKELGKFKIHNRYLTLFILRKNEIVPNN